MNQKLYEDVRWIVEQAIAAVKGVCSSVLEHDMDARSLNIVSISP